MLKIARDSYDKSTFFIKRCGSFGPDERYIDKFKCLAGIDNVCITPGMNIYPCVFLAKPGYEIGKVINGELMIDDDFANNGKLCLANEICNNSVDFLI